MAFNGITIRAITDELSRVALGGKIQKIAQPEPLGLLLTLHTESGKKLLYISANASLPLIHFTGENKPSPITAYSFVMVLRKHIGNAKIISVKQFGLERVIRIELEHLDEMKDVAKKFLYVEVMGKYSNIIFTDENDVIIDAIKHVPPSVSSVREVLPGRKYFIPGQENRYDLFECDESTFKNKVLYRPTTIGKAISSSFVGLSNLSGMELALRCGLDPDLPLDTLHESERDSLWQYFVKLKNDLINQNYSPCIVFDDKNRSLEFSPFSLVSFDGNQKLNYESISDAVEIFYKKRNSDNQIKQKSGDLKKLLTTLMERANKKLAIQEKQLEDTSKMEKLRIYGELLFAFGHDIKPHSKSITVQNYYDDNKEITIPLDPELNGVENSKKYFKKYDKLRRTLSALTPQIENSRREIMILSTIMAALQMAENDSDIASIRKELSEYGFIKKRNLVKTKNEKKNPPLHFITQDGFHLYVGKNNIQNEEVTFKIAKGNDWWFHVKTIPGGHVVLKDDGREIPDHVFEQAASLAAYYSTANKDEQVEVDYLKRKDVKRPGHGGKGFVIYYTNYSMNVVAGIDGLTPAN